MFMNKPELKAQVYKNWKMFEMKHVYPQYEDG